MGKKIDCFVLTAATAAALYLYFERAFDNRLISLLLALLGCAILRKFMKKATALLMRASWLEKRRIRRRAGGALMRLACLDESEAQDRVSALLAKSYGNDVPVELIQAHPSTNLSQDRLFDTWRAHRGKDRLVVCATCRCDAACRLLASSLKQPRIALVDAETIGELIAEHPESMLPEESPAKRPRLRIRHAALLLVNRKNAPRCLLFCGSMLMMYIFSGNAYYLASSLLLLLLALLSLRRTSRPAKLF